MICTEDYSMTEKFHLFNNAECIIGAHGSGLTNVIFSEKGAKVVDIYPPGDFDTFFWSLANSNEVDFYYFFGEGEMPTPDNDFTDRNIDITVDLNKFAQLMKTLNL